MKPGSRQLAIAEHLLNKSYPALKDPKILLSVLQNLLDAVEEAFTEKLKQARSNHEIPPYTDTLNGKLNAVRMHLAAKLQISKIDLMMISEMQELLFEHKNAPTEFRRKDALVIADDSFSIKTVDVQKTKTYMSRVRTLLTRL